MKNYLLKDYENLRALEEDMLKSLNKDFADLEIKSSKYTDCEILEVTGFTEFNGKKDFTVDVSCKGGIKSFCFNTCATNSILILQDAKKELLSNYLAQYEVACKEHKIIVDAYEAKLAEEARIETEKKKKAIEAYKAKKEAEEAEKKFQIRITKATEKFNSDIKRRVNFNVDTIDWLKENTLSISATIPSHLEKAFVGVFGDQEHKVVDSRRKTSGGYSMKFAPTFSLRIKKDTVDVPVELANKIKDNVLHDTSYIANLVRTYDFKFGKQG